VVRSRELLVLLARKDFHVRYRRASFGVLWAVALPLLQSAVMAVVFTKVVRLHVPKYAIFMLTGMVAWTYFASVFASGGLAIVDGSDLSSKVYFPRSLLPMVSAVTNLYALGITVVIVLGLCFVPAFGAHLGVHVLLLVPGVALLVAFTTSLCLVTAAVHVYFRDIRYIVSASLIVLLYVSPVIYTPNLAPARLRIVLDLNPLTGILDLFHASTVGSGGPMGVAVLVSVAWTLGLLVVASILHSRFDRVFSDLL